MYNQRTGSWTIEHVCHEETMNNLLRIKVVQKRRKLKDANQIMGRITIRGDLSGML